MRAIIRIGAALAACLWAQTGAIAAEDLPPDVLGVKPTIDMSTPNVFLFDDNFQVATRIHVLSGANLDYKGQIPSGYIVEPYLPPDGKTLYMATSYYSRYTSGTREDMIEVYDVASLSKKAEIPIPPKRAQAGPIRPLLQGSSDGHWLFVQNAIPATSVTVVDLRAGKTVGEIPTPGCWALYPAATQANRFSTLCGDGTIATYTLNDQGTAATRRASYKFFDTDVEPLFTHAERDGNDLLFMSFTGTVYRINAEGEAPEVRDRFPINLTTPGGWRPGGFQITAFHAPTRTLYVLMHKDGHEGTHKNPANEIWAVDVDSQKVIARSPSAPMDVLAIGKDAKPVLFGIAPESATAFRYAPGAKPGSLVETDKNKVGTWMTMMEVR